MEQTRHIISKKLFEQTRDKVEFMLRDFISRNNIEHTMEQSESGWVYVLHLPFSQGDVRIRLWSWRSENPTKVYSIPIRLPESIYKEHHRFLDLARLKYNEFNGKLVLLSFAGNIDKDIIDTFRVILAVISDIIGEMKRQQMK